MPLASPEPLASTGETTIRMPRVSPRTLKRSSQVPRPEPGAHLAVQEDGGVVLIPIPEGSSKVGRGFSVDIRLEDPTVSRRHAILVREGAATTVLDDRSANGVHVNGQRVQRIQLKDGDVLVLGSVSMRYVEVAD
jgi:pSer/pThr/pTyr-binding forkhead associated (FHA) protein